VLVLDVTVHKSINIFDSHTITSKLQQSLNSQWRHQLRKCYSQFINMDFGKPKTISLIVTKSTSQDIRPEFVRCCPTMDLIAIATRDERVDVFRLSGQRAFGIQRKIKDVQIRSLCWKFNGIQHLMEAQEGS
jgi:hypothetical protein